MSGPLLLNDEARAYIVSIELWDADPPWDKSLDVLRQDMRTGCIEAGGPPEAVAHVEAVDADGVPCRLYRPAGGESDLLIWVHGGGWVLGDLDCQDSLCRAFANRVQCAVLSVDYRLAPEHVFPAGLEDVWGATKWAAARFDSVAIAGDSAGGNLAAAIALRCRDEQIELAHQLLVYPVLDAGADAELHGAFRDRYATFKADNGFPGREVEFGPEAYDSLQRIWPMYVPDPTLRLTADASPMRAASVAGVAPATIVTAEHDILRGEAEAYARRLAEEGVPVGITDYAGQVHGFFHVLAGLQDARDAVDLASARLREAFGREGATQDSGGPSLSDIIRQIEEAGPVEPPTWPAASPRPEQSREDWLAETARLRNQADALVLHWARFVPQLETRFPGVQTSTYVQIPVDGATVDARVYVPAGEGPFPCVVFLHGGGFWMGGGALGFGLNDPLCRKLCNDLAAVVVNLDYRLAPEHPFPAQLEDTYSSVCWAHDNGAEYGIDPDRIAVMGISSGGNVAAAVARLLRDRQGPALRAQLLFLPALDLTHAARLELDDEMRFVAENVCEYYGGPDADWEDPLLSPAVAPDLEGLPPAVIQVGELDTLRDGGRRYGERLREAGVAAEILEYHMTHGIATPDVTRQWQDDLVSAARRIL